MDIGDCWMAFNPAPTVQQADATLFPSGMASSHHGCTSEASSSAYIQMQNAACQNALAFGVRARRAYAGGVSICSSELRDLQARAQCVLSARVIPQSLAVKLTSALPVHTSQVRHVQPAGRHGPKGGVPRSKAAP